MMVMMLMTVSAYFQLLLQYCTLGPALSSADRQMFFIEFGKRSFTYLAAAS